MILIMNDKSNVKLLAEVKESSSVALEYILTLDT